MQITESNTQRLSWEHAGLGLFMAEITDGSIAYVTMCRTGNEINRNVLRLAGDDKKFLRAVHESLGELLDYLDDKTMNVETGTGGGGKEG